MKIYPVKKSNHLTTDLIQEAKLWEDAYILSDFQSPWKDYIFSMEFSALYNKSHFFFQYKVYDTSIYIDNKENKKANINNSDRVEIFFRKDETLDPYYCLEIDPSPRIMDFIAHPNKDFNFNWNWPEEDLTAVSRIEKEYFIVKAAISLASLKKFGLLQGSTLQVGLFRAKYFETEQGLREPIWITWVDPKTKAPNFHIKSSFGLFKLV